MIFINFARTVPFSFTRRKGGGRKIVLTITAKPAIFRLLGVCREANGDDQLAQHGDVSQRLSMVVPPKIKNVTKQNNYNTEQ